MISSQCDADRMDYLLRDSYFTGAQYGNFDLDRILQVMRPYRHGICFKMSGLHAVEYYIVSRYQMYLQVYFHRTSRSMEIILANLLKRAYELVQNPPAGFKFEPTLLLPFLTEQFDPNQDLNPYLQLDDGVLNTYFSTWQELPDKILADLASRFLNRRPFKSVQFKQATKPLIPKLVSLINQAGFNPNYYAATDNSYNQPYDVYQPQNQQQNAPIELMQKDGSLLELSQTSLLVRTMTGRDLGDSRFFFPKEMLRTHSDLELFQPVYDNFQQYLKNDQIIRPKESNNEPN